MKKIFIALVAVILLSAGVRAESAKSSAGWVTAEPAEPVSVAAGRSATATLRFRVADGYHINSIHLINLAINKTADSSKSINSDFNCAHVSMVFLNEEQSYENC